VQHGVSAIFRGRKVGNRGTKSRQNRNTTGSGTDREFSLGRGQQHVGLPFQGGGRATEKCPLGSDVLGWGVRGGQAAVRRGWLKNTRGTFESGSVTGRRGNRSLRRDSPVFEATSRTEPGLPSVGGEKNPRPAAFGHPLAGQEKPRGLNTAWTHRSIHWGPPSGTSRWVHRGAFVCGHRKNWCSEW